VRIQVSKVSHNNIPLWRDESFETNAGTANFVKSEKENHNQSLSPIIGIGILCLHKY